MLTQRIHVWQDQAELDAARHRELERADLAFIDHRRQGAGALRRLVTLLEQRIHLLAERREHRRRTLAAEQVAAKLRLEQLDRARQRRLRDIALLRRAREVRRARDRQEIADLMHLHSIPLGDALRRSIREARPVSPPPPDETMRPRLWPSYTPAMIASRRRPAGIEPAHRDANSRAGHRGARHTRALQ